MITPKQKQMNTNEDDGKPLALIIPFHILLTVGG